MLILFFTLMVPTMFNSMNIYGNESTVYASIFLLVILLIIIGLIFMEDILDWFDKTKFGKWLFKND